MTAGAEMLELDPRELGVAPASILQGTSSGLWLYDTAAGGAGHILELSDMAVAWFSRAEALLAGDANHDRTCTDACLRCILTPRSQRDLESGKLGRREALVALRAAQSTPSNPTAKLAAQNPAESNEMRNSSQLSTEERLRGSKSKLVKGPPLMNWGYSISMLEDRWRPLAHQLSQSNLPAPDQVNVELSQRRVLVAWRRNSAAVGLVDADSCTADIAEDPQLIAVRPEMAGDRVAEAVRRKLKA